MKPLQLVDLDLPLVWVMEDLHNLMRLGLLGQLLVLQLRFTSELYLMILKMN